MVLVLVGSIVVTEYRESLQYEPGVCQVTWMGYTPEPMPCEYCTRTSKDVRICIPSSYPCLIVNVTYSVEPGDGGFNGSKDSARLYQYAKQEHDVSLQISSRC